jgi:hypothetical protein
VAGAVLMRPLAAGRTPARRRLAAVAMAGCALVSIGARLLPAPVTMHSFGVLQSTEESRSLPIYNRVVDDVTARRISGPEAARQIETEILPGWRRMRRTVEADIERFKRRPAVSPHEQQMVDILEQIITVRDDGWAAMVPPLRAGDYVVFEGARRDTEIRMQQLLAELNAAQAP